MRKTLLTLLLCFATSGVWAQSAIIQGGTITNYDIGGFTADHQLSAGSDIFTKNFRGFNPFHVFDNHGDGVCTEDALTNGAYHQFCLTHTADGTAILKIRTNGGASPKGISVDLDGVTYPFTSAVVNGIPFAADTTALQALSTATYGVVRRVDSGSGIGAPPVDFVASGSACSLNSGNGDIGSQVKSSDGKCWLAKLPLQPDAREWQISPSITDNYTQIIAARDWACSNKTVVLFPAGTYQHSQQIALGNGTSTSMSTQNNCGFISVGLSGAADIEMNPQQHGAVLKWTGADAVVGGVVVNGPMAGPVFSGFTIDCNSKCTKGLTLHYPIGGDFQHDMVVNWKSDFAFTLDTWGTGVTGTLTGGQHNTINDWRSMSPVYGTGASGLQLGGNTYIGFYDVAQGVISNSEFGFDNTVSTSCGIKLGYVDNFTFIQTVTIPLSGPNPTDPAKKGLCVSPPTGDPTGLGFPGSIAFVNSALVGGVQDPPGNWGGNLNFNPWPSGDGEPLPNCPLFWQCTGATDTGVPFGYRLATPIVGNTGTTPVNFQNNSFYVGGGGCWATNGFGCAINSPGTRHIESITLSLTASGTSGTGQTTVTVYLNNVATSMSCTITAPATSCTDNNQAHIVSVPSGGYVAYKISGNATSSNSAIGTATGSWSL